MGYCLYGNDIDDFTTPIEAGLSWITKFTKTFTASEYLQKQKLQKAEKQLVGFEMVDKGIPRHHYKIRDIDGNLIGNVTSGTQAPSLQKGIGMGYVLREFAGLDNIIYIEVRDKLLQAKVVKFPFA
jgi:aminomethyltransferase